MRRLVLIGLVLILVMVLLPNSPDSTLAQDDDCVIDFLTVWSGEDELPDWESMVAPFVEESGCTIEVESTRDLLPVLTTRVEAGNPPDIAGVPGVGAMTTFVEEGDLKPLDFLDMDRMQEQFGEIWLDLGTYEGELYLAFTRANVKSLVWYSPPAFEDAGYEVPTTWDGILDLCEQMADDGAACFSIGLESGPASGWPATDWIEDILLRTAPLDVYDAWVDHEIEWTSPEITRAWELFGEIATEEDYVFGGPAAVNSTNFTESPCAMFTDPPGAYMHRNATFIQAVIADCPGGADLVPGEDFDFFFLPPIDEEYGTPALGAADAFAIFSDDENVQELVRFLTSPEAMSGWLQNGGSGIAINNQFPLDLYPDPLTRRAGELFLEVDAFRFDASDQMPGDVNQAFWTGALNYVDDPSSLDDILSTIEETADAAYEE